MATEGVMTQEADNELSKIQRQHDKNYGRCPEPDRHQPAHHVKPEHDLANRLDCLSPVAGNLKRVQVDEAEQGPVGRSQTAAKGAKGIQHHDIFGRTLSSLVHFGQARGKCKHDDNEDD